MSLNNPRPGGPNHVPEYQLSSIPYALNGAINTYDVGTALEVLPTGQNAGNEVDVYVVEFPRVTRWLYFRAGAAALKVYFSSQTAADAKRGFSLAASENTGRLEMRVKKLYFADADDAKELNILAGLTTVDAEAFEGHIEHFVDNNNKVG